MSKNSVDKEGTIDTGLGTESVQEEHTSRGEETHIVGKALPYMDASQSSASNLSEDGNVIHFQRPFNQIEFLPFLMQEYFTYNKDLEGNVNISLLLFPLDHEY